MFTKPIKKTGIAALLVLTAFLLAGSGPVRASSGPYVNDANTVLLDHFDGATSASILAYSETGAACGSAKPSATPNSSFVTGPSGLSQALSLNFPSGQPAGSATYLQYPGGQLLSQPNGTIEFWVYLTTYGTGVSLVDQGQYYGDCVDWTFGMGVNAAGQLTAGAWNAFNMNSGTTTIPLNTWTHVAATWGSTGAKLYINGVQVGSDANTGMPASGFGGSVLIRAGSHAGAGQIDELRISNVQRTDFPAADGTGTHNAGGTYTWNAGTGGLTLIWASSDFTCDGPELGTETKTGVTVTATTMTWADGMTWTRPSGTAGDIVGTWNSTDSATGNPYTLTFNVDSTVSVTAVIVRCGDSGGGNPPDPFTAFSSHDFSGYYAYVFVNDPSPALYSAVKVTGPGLPPEGVNLAYNNGQWWLPQGTTLPLGQFLPTTYPSFHFSATKNAGGTDEMDRQITGYVSDFVTVTSPAPSATINTPPTFSWTWPGATAPDWYGINIMDNTTHMPVWSNYNIPGNQTSVNYTGPALISGHQYNYSLTAGIGPNSSMVNGAFTFNTGGGATISMSGILNGVGGQPISGAQIEQVGNAAVVTTTDSSGNFILTGLPAGTNFTVKMSKTGDANNYAPFYTQQFNAAGGIPLRTYTLFTEGDLNAWGVTTGGGVIRGRVADNSNVGTNNLSGAVVTFTTSNSAPNYTVKYQTDSGALVDGPGTFANGVYFILNVQEGDVVTLSAAKAEYNLTGTKTFITHAGGVSQGNLPGAAPAGAVTLGGYVQNKNLLGLGGVLVEAISEATGATIRSTTSQGPDGVYSLPVPTGANFYLKFSNSGYYPTYTGVRAISQYTFDDSTRSYTLFTNGTVSPDPDQFASTNWNVTPGAGVIRARVKDQSGNFVAGATVTYTSSLGNTYPIFYADNCNDPTFTATQAGSGRYCIKNVAPGDIVTVNAHLSGWTFNSQVFYTSGSSVYQGGFTGTNSSSCTFAIAPQSTSMPSGSSLSSPHTINVTAASGCNWSASTTYAWLHITGAAGGSGNGMVSWYHDANMGGTRIGTITIADQIFTVTQDSALQPMVNTTHQQSDGKYYLEFWVIDPGHVASSVTVTGANYLPPGGINLVYDSFGGGWRANQIFEIGTIPDLSMPSYTFTFEPQPSGQAIAPVTRSVTGYVTEFVTNLQPQGNVSGPITFSWTGVAGASAYGVSVWDGPTQLWGNPNIPANQNSIPYGGPPLAGGKTYQYYVGYGVSTNGGWNNSQTHGSFTYSTGGTTISMSGTLNGVGGQPISGAQIEQVGNAAVITTTDSNGNFTLMGLPAGTNFTVKMSKVDANNYAPTYTHQWNAGGNIGTRTYQLFTQNDLTNWGVGSGGVIRGRVADGSNAGTNNLTGAVVTFTSSNQSPNYVIKYQQDDGTMVDGPGTFANGIYFILNVQEGDAVQVSASKSGYAFPTVWKTFVTHAGGVSLGNITGNPPLGNVTLGGYVQTPGSPSIGMGGVLVEAINETGAIISSTLSQGPDGVYSLPVPSGMNLYLRFSKTGYYPTYTAVKNISQYFFDDITKSYNLLTSSSPDQFDSTHWDVTAGQGVIRARVKDQSGNFVDGATVTYTSSLGNTYPIFYADDCKATTFTSTQPGSGRYCIKNVAPGDTVTVTAQKAGWTFNSPIFHVNSGGVFQGSVIGTLLGVDDGLIRSGFAALVTEFNKGAGANIDTIMSFFSVNYLNDGRDYNAEKADMQASLNRVPFRPISGVITGLTVTGNTATMTVDMGDKIETMYLAKEGDGAWRLSGNQARHEVRVSSQHWQNGYSANISVGNRAGITIDGVTVTGPGINGTASLAGPHDGNGWWFDGNGPSWGPTPPVGPQTFNITVYEGSTPYSYQRTITGFVTDFAVPTSPIGSFGSPVVFTWRGIAGAAEYSVELNTEQGQRVWSKYNLSGNQWLAVYDGPQPLTAGNYNYNVVARKSVDGGDGYSFASGMFTYTGSAQATVTYTGNVFDKDGVLVGGVLVEQVGGPPNASSAVSDTNGVFTLANILKSVPSAMKLSNAGYVPSYRHYQARGGNANFADAVATSRSLRIYTAADLSAWGVAAGKGIIRGQVEDAGSGNNPAAEATVLVMSALGRAYTVKYCDATGANCWTTGVTDSSGNFRVMDVEEGDMVVVSAQKAGLNFSNPTVWGTHGGSVHTGWVRSTPPPSCTYSINPPSVTMPSGSSLSFPHTINVTAGSNCPWFASVSPTDGWLHITGPTNSSGSGTVSWYHDSNTGGARRGTITVAGQTFTVDQEAGTPPPSANLLVNGDFSSGLNGWNVAPSLGDWSPLQAGAVSLNPPAAGYSGYLGTVIFQNLNLTNIAGKRINFFLNLTNQFLMSSGKTIVVYLTYYDTANVMHRVKIFSPDNSTIGMNTPFNISYDVPADAAKLVKLEIVKEDYGEFLVDNIWLTGDGIAAGPLPTITNLSANSGSYGSTIVITGNNFGAVPGKVTIRGVSQQINSWSDNSINITIIDSTPSGHLSVTTDFVQSNRYEFGITSPYYTVNLLKNTIKVIKGQKAEFLLNVQTFNNYTTAQGINFSNSNAGLNAFFTPLPIKNSGGLIMRIDTTNLAAGTYQGNIQANDGSPTTRTVPFTLQVVTVTDLKFYDSTYDPISSAQVKTYYTQKDVLRQGTIDFGIWNIEATASDGSLLSGIPLTFTGHDPALIGIYRDNSGIADFFAEGANGQTAVNVVAPDGFAKAVNFNINIPPTPRINSLGLSPSVVTNKYADPLSFFAAGTQLINPGRRYGFLNIKEDTRSSYDEGRSVSGTFKLDLATPPELGTYLFTASIYGAGYPAAAEKVVPLTITNDPSYALLKGGVRSIDSTIAPYNLGNFMLEFYNDLGVKEFSRAYSSYMHFEEPNFAIGAIPPGTYRIKFVGGSPTVKSQWWPNADNMSGALPVTLTAGAVRDDVYFFASTAPTISFAGSVRDSAGNPVAGANVEVMEFVNVWTSTDDAGNFTLNGIPAGQQFTVNLWKSGYVETYSGTLNSPGNIQSLWPFTLLTTAEVGSWPVGIWQAGKGMIMSRVVESGNPAQAVGGAQISVTSARGNTYNVTYFDGSNFGGAATAPNGLFYIYGIEAGDTVTVTAFKEGWAFSTNTYEVRGDGISEQLLFGTSGVVPTVHFYGAVRDKNGNPVMGATIETVGLDPVIQTTSDGVGNFALSGIPMNQVFHLKISMAGYLPTYTRNQSLQGNDMVASRPFVLRTAGQVYTDWGVIAGKSVVEGRVFDAQDPMDTGIGGVVITAVGNSNRVYTVTYKDDAGNSRTDRTYGNGRYFVLNVDPGDTIMVTAKKASWSFPTRVFAIHADGISQGNAPGTRTPAGVFGGQDIGRENYGPTGSTWWTDANRITITANATGPGGTVAIVQTRNEGGVITHPVENFAYSSFTRNADGTYTMWKIGDNQPPEAVTMALSEDGSMIILDGAAQVGDRRLDLLVRMADPTIKTYSNIDLSSDYYGIGYEHNANPVTPPGGNGANMAISNVTAFNGAGNYTYIGRANSDGLIWTDDERTHARSYTVNADGSVSIQGGAFLASLAGNGNILTGGGSYFVGDAGTWASYIFLKKGDKVYSTADLAGTWAFAGYGDTDGITRALFGTLNCDAAGICNITGKSLNDDGTTNITNEMTILTVNADGSLGNAPGSTVPLGAIGNGGRTIIWNLSFDPNKAGERRIVVATKIGGGVVTSPITNKVWAGTHHDGGEYYGDFVVDDPNHVLSSVTVQGGQLGGSQNLTYRSDAGAWWTVPQLFLGTTSPGDSYYSVTMIDGAGNQRIVQQRLSGGGVVDFATNLSPAGDHEGKITFSFTGIAGADGYMVALFDANGSLVWQSGKGLATSVPYDGPPLPSGMYYYLVHSWIGNNSSVARSSLNHTAAVQYPAGDLNHDRNVDLADAIIALRAVSVLDTPVVFVDGDVNNDGSIGMAEALFAMQTVAGLRVTDHQAAVNGILASLEAYKTTVNNKGAAITPADLLPFFHPAYLDDGLDRNMAAQDDLPDGVLHIDAFTVNKVLFFDDVRKIITAEITFSATVNGISEIDIFTETFAYDQAAGKWLRFGNQRIGQFSVWLGKSRTMPAAGGSSDTLIFHPHFTAAPNTVSQVAVSGPALGGTVIYANPRSETENGITIERFYLFSQGGTEINFSQPVPALGDTYTMAVTKKTGGVVTYNQVLNGVMLEAPLITSPTGHELTAANIGSPLNVTWTLPSAGIVPEEIRLEGQVCNAAFICEHVIGTITSLTSGTITLPGSVANPVSAYVDVRIHKGGEVFTNCRFEFGN